MYNNINKYHYMKPLFYCSPEGCFDKIIPTFNSKGKKFLLNKDLPKVIYFYLLIFNNK